MQFGKTIQSFLAETDGTTTVEYCVMLAMILLAVMVGITAAGNSVLDWWTNIGTDLNANGF
ncbi:MAG: Flp family type IVb pilin [Fuerstiella sp.]|nr:Flp family type IVb pilin [Fuerstiella sp.]MCP4782224.1 Flp family type IVb pilin [Fuerstiella sp.]MCP4855642.1 Flp family type IVb pilin [Fuerstiella sp.]